MTPAQRLLAAAAVIAASVASAPLPAFPGAVGFGAAATGGRGGAIVHVTTLADDGPGSLRAAVAAPNRFVVFDVGGYVRLASALSVASNITIAGQTAPGGGFGVQGGEVSLTGHDNVILRGLRLRQGRLDPDAGKSALNIGKSSRVIVDSCSIAYGQWDSVDAVGAANFTVSRCIIGDPIGQQFGAHVEGGPATFHSNAWVNAHNRQPLAKADTQFVNNVIYDFEAGYTSGNTGGAFSHDIVGNYFVAGPRTTSPSDAYFQMDAKQSVYTSGNFLDGNRNGALDGAPYDTVKGATPRAAPWSPSTAMLPTLPAVAAFAVVLATAGAAPRDAVDAAVMRDVASVGTSGDIIKDQNATGVPDDGYGALASGAPFPDAAGDGIADWWAGALGVRTDDPSAGTAPFRDSGYMNVEAYANALVLPPPWVAAAVAADAAAGAAAFEAVTGTWALTGSGDGGGGSGYAAVSPWAGAAMQSRVDSVAGGDGGLVLRAATAGGAASPFAALTANASGGVAFRWRAATGGGEERASVPRTGLGWPVWLRISGGSVVVVAAYSADGVAWTPVGPPAGANVTWGAAGAIGGLVCGGGAGGGRGVAVMTAVARS